MVVCLDVSIYRMVQALKVGSVDGSEVEMYLSQIQMVKHFKVVQKPQNAKKVNASHL